MKRTAAVFISIGVVLVIVGLVMVGIFGRDALKDFSWSDIINGSMHDLTKANADKEIPEFTELYQIKIDVARYSAYVLPSDDGVMRVRYVEPLEGNANLDVTYLNGILSISETDNLKSSWFGLGSKRFIAVYLPQTELFVNTALTVNADTASVNVRDVALSNLTATTETGTISINGGKINDAYFETETGSISIDSLNCYTLTVKTETGSAKIKNTIASLSTDIKTETGSVNCNIDTTKLTVSCETGSVNFTTNASNINVKTETGSVNGTVQGYKADYQITVTKGTGSSNINNQQVANANRFLTVNVKTGSINIKFVNN